MTDIKVRVIEVQALGEDDVIPVSLSRGADKRPREALVMRGGDGRPRAYLNLCRHLPVPLDGGSRRFLAQTGEHLLCGTHGAQFRRDDGMCVVGPCLHLALHALPCVEEDGVLYVLDPVPSAPHV